MGRAGAPFSNRIAVPLLVSWTIALTYFGASRGIRNFFPLSVFDMYQERAPDVASRVVAVDAEGRTREIGAYTGFHCEPARPSLADTSRCPSADGVGRIDYVVRDLQIYVDAHSSSEQGPEPMQIVWRRWKLEETPGPPVELDCVLARCTAQRMGRDR